VFCYFVTKVIVFHSYQVIIIRVIAVFAANVIEKYCMNAVLTGSNLRLCKICITKLVKLIGAFTIIQNHI